MTARKTNPSPMGSRRPRKSLKPPVKKTRLRLSLKLTLAESKKLRERAAADMRSIAGYVAFVVTAELRRLVEKLLAAKIALLSRGRGEQCGPSRDSASRA